MSVITESFAIWWFKKVHIIKKMWDDMKSWVFGDAQTENTLGSEESNIYSQLLTSKTSLCVTKMNDKAHKCTW